jgi:hypothetical protein
MPYELSEPLAVLPIAPDRWHVWPVTTQQIAIAHDIGISSSTETPPFYYETRQVWLNSEGAIALIGEGLGSRPAVPGEPPHYWNVPEAPPLPDLVPAIALRSIRPAPLRWHGQIFGLSSTPQYAPLTEFSYTGALQTFELPNLLNYRVKVLIWGCGGGPSIAGFGGNGGFTEALFTVGDVDSGGTILPGTYWIAVGAGGARNQTIKGLFGGGSVANFPTNPGGGGGDFSGIGRGATVSQGSAIAIAGGGGGTRGNPYGTAGGHGGGLSGGSGRSGNLNHEGKGGTQAAGGGAGTAAATVPAAMPGSQMSGGDAGIWSSSTAMGAGGAGYWGGGAGATHSGGGGSGYSRSPNATLTAGTDAGPGNASSPLRPAGVGAGGQPGQTKGGDGFVRIEILEPL